MKELKHTRPTVKPYGQRGILRIFSRLNKPEESIYRIVLLHGSQCFWRQVDIARVLLLVWIYGLTDCQGWVLVSNEDFGVVAGSDLFLVFQ